MLLPRLKVCRFPAADEHQVFPHAERAFSCVSRSQHGLHQASVGHLFGPCETGDGPRGEPATKKTGRSLTGTIIGPFSTGADQYRPFIPEASGVTAESYRSETSESQCAAGESERQACV